MHAEVETPLLVVYIRLGMACAKCWLWIFTNSVNESVADCIVCIKFCVYVQVNHNSYKEMTAYALDTFQTIFALQLVMDLLSGEDRHSLAHNLGMKSFCPTVTFMVVV